jgi:acetyl esterase/lipase
MLSMRGTAALICAPLLAVTLAACSDASPTPPHPAAGSSTSAPGTTSTPPPPAAPPLAAGAQTTLTYCNGEKARLTEPTHSTGPAPAAIYVHGGSWVSGNDQSGGFLIKSIGPDLAAKGFVVVSLDYRLGPARQWPDQIEDVKCAVRYLRANAHALNVDPQEIGAWGQSAGGHLVALLGTAGPAAGWDVGPYPEESSQVEAVVDMAGPSDLLTLGDQGGSLLVQESFLSLIGGVPADRLATTLKAASPVTWIARGDPPFLLVQSTDDEIVYPQQSRELAWDLTANGVPNQLLMVDGGGHEFDNQGENPNQAGIVAAVEGFFIRTLVLHQPIAGA